MIDHCPAPHHPPRLHRGSHQFSDDTNCGALHQLNLSSVYMDSQRLSSLEQGALRVVVGILEQHGMSFEEATNGVLEQPPPLDAELRDTTQRFSLQAADMLLPGQNTLSTIFQPLHGQPGPDYASLNPWPSASSGFIFDTPATDHGVYQLGEFLPSNSISTHSLRARKYSRGIEFQGISSLEF